MIPSNQQVTESLPDYTAAVKMKKNIESLPTYSEAVLKEMRDNYVIVNEYFDES